MILFVTRHRNGEIEYRRSSETKEITFNAAGGTAVGIFVTAAGIGGVTAWLLTLGGFLVLRQAFSDGASFDYPLPPAAHEAEHQQHSPESEEQP